MLQARKQLEAVHNCANIYVVNTFLSHHYKILVFCSSLFFRKLQLPSTVAQIIYLQKEMDKL